jgi:GTPase SAR1 family protein
MGTPVHIVVIGNVSVGKTSLISRYVTGEFLERPEHTIGVDFQVYEHPTHGLRLIFWDTAG